MKKYRIMWLFLTLLLVIMPLNVQASERQKNHYDDEYGLLDNNRDKKKLDEFLNDISTQQECDVSIAVIYGFEGHDLLDYANDFYDQYGYGYGDNDDGILLMIDMASRQWAVSTYGFGIHAFTDEGIDYIMSKVSQHLSQGDYKEAFYQFGRSCEEFIDQARKGQPFFDGTNPEEKTNPIVNYAFMAVGSLSIGLIIAFGVMHFQKRGLKSVSHAVGAANYVSAGGLSLTRQQEVFLGRSVHRQRKPQNPPPSANRSSQFGGTRTIRTSSSGRNHGGRSGSF